MSGHHKLIRLEMKGSGDLKEQDKTRLIAIMQAAKKLHWIIPQGGTHDTSYPLMQLSEVEKCMLAMVDDFELEWILEWARVGSFIKPCGCDHGAISDQDARTLCTDLNCTCLWDADAGLQALGTA
jgi:hypothetical protein